MSQVTPLCPVFDTCGGCSYQDIDYKEELSLKEKKLQDLFKGMGIAKNVFDPIVSSPEDYHYRHRLDLRLQRTQERILIGFTAKDQWTIVEVESCFIAKKEISDFIPQLKKEAIEKLPAKYRQANLTLKVGDDGRFFWGGIGKRSTLLKEDQYLWTEIHGKRIHYSLETFFQANLSILPKLIDTIVSLNVFNSEVEFFDLYGGVGLFSVALSDHYKKSYLIEHDINSTKLAQYNMGYNHLQEKIEIISLKVERALKRFEDSQSSKVAMIDPPRAGLSEESLTFFAEAKAFKNLLYLSCNPETLKRDLAHFLDKGWSIKKMIPLDFFPRTSHLETLAVLSPNRGT